MVVTRSGSDCRMAPCVDDGLLYLEMLWNTPLHSWTGVASEAVDYVVPLADRLPNLAVASKSTTPPVFVKSRGRRGAPPSLHGERRTPFMSSRELEASCLPCVC